MPRPNPPRTIDSEALLAARVAFEREARGWSLERLADEMGQAGCPIQASAIFKIEKGRPRRRITVDELAGFAEVFQTAPGDLLKAPKAELQQLLEQWDAARRAAWEADDLVNDRFRKLATYLARDDDLFDPFLEVISNWAKQLSDDPARQEFDIANTLSELLPERVDLDERAVAAARSLILSSAKRSKES